VERTLLQRASVVGRVFWDKVLENLSTPPESSATVQAGPGRSEILDALEGLRRKELIFRREASAFAGATEYVFKHELLRHATTKACSRSCAVSITDVSRPGSSSRAANELRNSPRRWPLISSKPASQQKRQNGTAAPASRLAPATSRPWPLITSARRWIIAEWESGGAEVQAKRLDWLEGLSDGLGAQARFAEAIEVCARVRSLSESWGSHRPSARLERPGVLAGAARGQSRVGGSR